MSPEHGLQLLYPDIEPTLNTLVICSRPSRSDGRVSVGRKERLLLFASLFKRALHTPDDGNSGRTAGMQSVRP
jgi:hypothetical protein